VDLDALVGDLDGDPGGVQLRHRDLAHGVLAVHEAPGGRVDHLPRGLDLRRHLGELVPRDLEAADRPAERGPLAGVLERLVEHALRAGDAARRADQPLALELPHDVVEAAADLAEGGARGDADVLEGEERRVGRVHPELLEALLAHDAGKVHVDEEEREAVVAGVRVGLRDEHDEVGPVAVRDVRLRAVDDEVVAVPRRPGADAGDVGARVGLGDAEARDSLAADRGREVLLLLLLGAEGEDRRRRHGCARRGPSPARRSARGRAPRRGRCCTGSRRPGRRAPPASRARGTRARPWVGRPSRRRCSVPTRPREARAPSGRTRVLVAFSRMCLRRLRRASR
jgi:hypothetical protein